MIRASIALISCLVVMVAAPAHAQSLIRDAEIEAMLYDYGDPLFRAAGLRSEDIGIYIVADNSMNAFVTRGQNVFLNTGIILEADTPNQLQGVMAHETGHISGGHLLRMGEAQSQAMTTMFLTMGVGLLAVLAGAPDAGAAVMASSQQFAALNFMTHTRVQESNADQAAIEFMETAGISPEGIVGFFERFRHEEVLAERQQSPYFRTHPLSSARIAALRKKISESDFRDYRDSPEEIARLQLVQGKIYGFLETPQRVFRVYKRDDDSMPARYARAVALYRSGALDKAVEEVDSLIESDPDYPYFHELKGQMYFESGKADLAIEPYRKSVELEPDQPLLEVGLAQSLIRHGEDDEIEEAIGLLKKSLRAEHDNSYAWYQLSLAYNAQGKTSLAQLAVAEQSFASGDLRRAAMFAHRAKEGLETGTLDWRRASDILSVSEPMLRAAAEQRRR